METKNIQCPKCYGVAYDTGKMYMSNPPQYGFLCECCKEITYLDKYPNKSYAMEWISVNDRLPEQGQDILISDGQETVVGLYNSETWWYKTPIGYFPYRHFKPTYYIPLPEPPKQ